MLDRRALYFELVYFLLLCFTVFVRVEAVWLKILAQICKENNEGKRRHAPTPKRNDSLIDLLFFGKAFGVARLCCHATVSLYPPLPSISPSSFIHYYYGIVYSTWLLPIELYI